MATTKQTNQEGDGRETRPEIDPAARGRDPVRGGDLRGQERGEMDGRRPCRLRRRLPARGDGRPPPPPALDSQGRGDNGVVALSEHVIDAVAELLVAVLRVTLRCTEDQA